jgi:hypothetical protein
MSVSDFSLYSANVGQSRPSNSLCDQLHGSLVPAHLEKWTFGIKTMHGRWQLLETECMGTMEANSSIRGAVVSLYHIQNFREVVFDENSKWGRTDQTRGPEPGTIWEASAGRAPGEHLGAGPTWLRPPSTADDSHSSVVFDNCPDVEVRHPTSSGLLGSTSIPKVPKPNDA